MIISLSDCEVEKKMLVPFHCAYKDIFRKWECIEENFEPSSDLVKCAFKNITCFVIKVVPIKTWIDHSFKNWLKW